MNTNDTPEQERRNWVARFKSASGTIIQTKDYDGMSQHVAQELARIEAESLGAHCDDWTLTEKKT